MLWALFLTVLLDLTGRLRIFLQLLLCDSAQAFGLACLELGLLAWLELESARAGLEVGLGVA